MARKLLDFLRNHAADAVTILGTLGFGTVFAVAEDAQRMVEEHATAAFLLTAAAFCLGAAVSRFASEGSAWARRRKRVDRLERVFLSASKRGKSLVARALDDGVVELSPYDPDALMLCDLGIFGMPPMASVHGTRFSVQPGVVREIRDHRSEWLGM